MSRAFVKEDDPEQASYMDDEKHRKKLVEWLRIQEKKLDYLLNDPKAVEIEREKREKWIDSTRADIEKTKEQLAAQ